MDKKQALAELIKGLKRVKSDLETEAAAELAKAEPEETFSQKLRKKMPKVVAPKTDQQIVKPSFKQKLKQVGAALIKEDSEQEKSESSAEGSEKTEASGKDSKKDSKSRFKDMLFAMKGKKK